MKFTRAALLGGALVALLTSMVQGQTCFQPIMYTVSENADILREVELSQGTTIAEHVIAFPGLTVTGLSGLAIQPSTGVIYPLMKTDQPPTDVPFLVTFG